MKTQLTRTLFSLGLAAVLGIAGGMWAVLPSAAFPVSAAVSPHAANGLFPKIRYPKINFGKGAKAALHSAAKTTGNSAKVVGGGGKAIIGGGKAVVNGGVAAVKGAQKGAQKGAEIYEAGRALSSKTNGVPGLPHLR